MNITEYLKYLSSIRDRISDLCKQSLFEKWYIGSEHNICSNCPFCDERMKRHARCKECLCPPEIYNNDDLLTVFSYYDEIHIKEEASEVGEIRRDKLDKMISLFQKWIINE